MKGTSTGGPRNSSGPGTQTRILDIAERLVQHRGFNSFTYADVAGELHVTKASLHYHFATKAILGEALIIRYTERFMSALERIAREASFAPARLEAYTALFAEQLREGRICLCGMLAAEYPTLDKPIQKAVTTFLDQNEAWLEKVLQEGRAEGSLRFDGDAGDAARAVLGGLEGAMLVARPYEEPDRFRVSAARLLRTLTGAVPSGPSRP